MVGIRSCVMESNQLMLFGGAGIVEGSNAESEWQEVDLKLKSYKNLFNNEKKYQSLAECWSNLIIEEYVRHGVEYACISPGSRSTLLVKAIAEHPKIKSYVHFDERSNGFFATGLARQTQKPVLVITTSGTAVANLLPSCIEAYEQNIPVLYLTADRPFELLGCGANQSIQQETILKDWVHHYKTIPTATQEISAKWVLKQVDETILHSSKGPIHLNLQYREPF